MPYQGELALLTETFRKMHVDVQVIPKEFLNQAIQQSLIDIFPGYSQNLFIPALPVPSHRECYRYADACGLCYTYLLLPDQTTDQLVLIGPYLHQAMSPEQLLELGESMGIAAQAQAKLAEYASALPVVDRESPLFLMLNTFCERIWSSPSFALVNVNVPPASPASPIHEPLHDDQFDDILLQMKAMEQRYAFENELIRAVSLGQLHVEDQIFTSLSETQFEKRLADPLRNAKNYAIIMNTLLRKAAESGGVHPLYIDRVSSDFARRIEQMTDLSESSTLMLEIFRGYCLLVQQHALRHYSRVVQTAILLIDSDLSANLTLHSLAQNQGISPGYLSTVFKKETGVTITAYIRDKRMRHARHLLSTTNLQIQTVAMHCGILDVHFFTKLFKKATGMTPKQYRQSVKH